MEIAYWAILIIWILIIKVLRWDSGVSLKIAFVLFLISAALTVLTLSSVAETVMRVSFIGWLIGIFQALIEYIKQPK